MRYAVPIVFIVVLCVTGALALRLHDVQIQLDQQSIALNDVRARLDGLTAQMNTVAAVQANVDQLQTELADIQKHATESAAGPGSRESAALPRDEATRRPEESEADGETEPDDPAMDAAMRALDGKMMVDMEYGALLRDFSLPAESIKPVRNILAGHIARGEALFDEEMDTDDEHWFEKQEKAEQANLEQLKRELSEVLTPEELAEWEAYEEDKERRMLEFQLDTEIATFGSAMDDETRQTVRDILAEEMFNSADFVDIESTDPMDFMGMETQQIARARERIVASLTADQYQQAEAFLQHKEEMAEASAEMFRHWMQEAERNGDIELNDGYFVHIDSEE